MFAVKPDIGKIITTIVKARRKVRTVHGAVCTERTHMIYMSAVVSHSGGAAIAGTPVRVKGTKNINVKSRIVVLPLHRIKPTRP